MAKFGFLKQQSGTLRKVLGAIILASVGLTYYNDTHSSTTYTNTNHGLGAEQTMLINGISPYPAPKIDGITAWINSAPLSLAELKGKIVLIDFWTYSCINCIRTLPHLINMYAKYHNKGLIIIGVHTPEFDFEKTLANVTSAVKKDGIPYPVALDSNYVTWQNFDNKYWPAEYLIDKNGNVVYQHFGEGENDVMENNIRFLLGINQVTNETPANENLADLIEQTTPETYLGSARAASFASPEKIIPNISSIYSFPDVLEKNNWALQGAWIISGENIISASEKAAIKINFHAKNVYIVMGNNSKKPLAIKILYNGESVIKHKGKDVINSAIQVTDHTLYEALAFDKPETGVLEIIAPRAGLELYTFTFGNK